MATQNRNQTIERPGNIAGTPGPQMPATEIPQTPVVRDEGDQTVSLDNRIWQAFAKNNIRESARLSITRGKGDTAQVWRGTVKGVLATAPSAESLRQLIRDKGCSYRAPKLESGPTAVVQGATKEGQDAVDFLDLLETPAVAA